MLPTLYPFGSKERWLEAAPAFFGPEEQDRVPTFLDRNIVPVFHGPELALYLGISPRLVSHMVTHAKKYYTSFQIKKKNGDPRIITAPRVFLKTIQRYILDCILSPLPLHPAATGFRRGFNCSMGAGQHVGCRFLWNIDIANFFPSITQKQITSVFESIGYPSSAAYFLSGLCCLEKRLPQGAPTSPALANLAVTSLDKALSTMSEKAGINYTRYADDLSFSSNNPLSQAFRKKVIAAIHKVGFKLQRRKTRLMGPKIRREVTGLTVNDRVSIPRFRRRQLRAYFHKIRIDPSPFIEEKSRAIGLASWLYDYHPKEGEIALAAAKSIPNTSGSNASKWDLTRREVEVLELLRTGVSDKEIAHALGVSRATASKHVENILKKMKVTNRTAAARRAEGVSSSR
jgi:RNA-directed DNA polymerase